MSNRIEFEQGSDPNNPVYVTIAEPAASPNYINNLTVDLEGTSSNADAIEITNETIEPPGTTTV